VASLQKTYSGDLTTSIAGVIWDRIKQADEKRQLEKSKASEEVKQAAVKLKKEDSNSLPVQDKNLRDTVVKIFGPLEGKLLQTEGKVDNLSSKITMIAGGISDTQKLLVSRSQLLEEKFDDMLKVVGSKSAIEKQREAESKFEDMENTLEKGLDLSGTFAYEKIHAGSYGILGKLLSGILGNRYTYQLMGQISKKLLPGSVKAKAKLLKSSLRPVRKFARKLVGKGPGSFSRNLLKGALKPITMRFTGGSIRALGKMMLGTKWSRSTVQGKVLRGAAMRFLGKSYPEWMADRIVKSSGLNNAGQLSIKGLMSETDKTKAFFRAIQTGDSEKAIASVSLEKLNKNMSGGIFAAAMRSERVQKALLERLGPEGFEKLTVKFGKGAIKGGFPVAGSIYGALEGLVRLSPAFGGSDWKGALLSLGSGLPLAGWGFTAIDILRDIDVKAYTKHIEGKVPPSNDDIANFFSDALGIRPEQYEMGNVNIKAPTSGMGSNINSISEILSVTKAFGDAAGFGREVQGAIKSAGLSSYPTISGNYHFDIGKAESISTVKGKEAQKETEELRMRKKKVEEEKQKPEDPDKDNESEKSDDTDGYTGGRNRIQRILDPLQVFSKDKKGGGGIGGDDNVQATTPIMGGDGATIEFWGQQGRDLSGEPGVDFSYRDYKSNYNLFPGYVLETGLLYGARYGNVVVVRSVDPSNGLEFDSLYSHFPDGGMAVKPGQVVSAGAYLGKVGFVSVDVPGVPQMQPNNAGNMSGWHTSVDFFEPGSAARYRNLSAIQSLVTGADGRSPDGLLEKLKPPSTSNDQSSLNNIEANSKSASFTTAMVEKGSNERMMTKRKIAKRLPVVIINNQVVNTSQTQIAMGNIKESGNFFEAYNLARYTV